MLIIGGGEIVLGGLLLSVVAFKVLNPLLAAAFLLSAAAAAYLKLKEVYSYWQTQGIDGPPPSLLMGNNLEYKECYAKFDRDCYAKYGETYGTYLLERPALCSMDLDMIRQCLVKKSAYFADRSGIFSGKFARPNGNDIVLHTLMALRGEHHRNVRAHVSPALTSSKISKMVPVFDHCARLTCTIIDEINERGEFVDLKETMGRLTLDMISQSAIGKDFNVQSDENAEFFLQIKEFLNYSLKDPAMFVAVVFPNLFRLVQDTFGVCLQKRQSNDYLIKLLSGVLEERLAESKRGESGNDFYSLLLKSLKEEDKTDDDTEILQENVYGRVNRKTLTKMDIVGSVMIFLMAGFDTSSSALSMLFWNLAKYPEVQRKVQAELEEIVGNEESITPQQVTKLQYLEQVFCETLRLEPSIARTTRVCNEDININGIAFRKDDAFNAPIMLVHYDPKNYPEPHRFNPDRFSPEERAKRDPLTFLPFGAGPRNCIGMRVAQFQIKTAVAQILRRFDVEMCDKSPAAPRITKAGPMKFHDPLLVRFRRRTTAFTD